MADATSTLGTKGGRVTPRKSREGGTLIEAVSARAFPTPSSNDWKGSSRGGAASRPAHGPGHGRDIGGRKTESGVGCLADVLAARPLENQWWQVEPGRGEGDG